MLAIVNPTSGGGRALERWRRVECALRGRTDVIAPAGVSDPRPHGDDTGTLEVVITGSVEEVDERVQRALASGHRRFIAAGGDGTVNVVARALLRRASEDLLPAISLGAVGLGSSNDFHKPVQSRIAGAPCRVDFGSARACDIGIVSYEDLSGLNRTRPWIINASIGTTAETNRLFNDPDRLLVRFKRLSTGLAIAYAAAKTVLTFRPRGMELTVDRSILGPESVHNLGIVKSPHFAGSLRYDSPHEPASGSLFVHLLEAVSLPRLALALIGLMRGKFMGKPGTSSWKATEAAVRCASPFAVEIDGEIIMTRAASFWLLPAALRVCP